MLLVVCSVLDHVHVVLLIVRFVIDHGIIYAPIPDTFSILVLDSEDIHVQYNVSYSPKLHAHIVCINTHIPASFPSMYVCALTVYHDGQRHLTVRQAELIELTCDNVQCPHLQASVESVTSFYSDAGEGNYGKIPVTGEIQFGLDYNYKTGTLEVRVKQCKDIAIVDSKKKRSDP